MSTKPTTRTFALSGPINLYTRVGNGSLVVRAEDDCRQASVVLTPHADSTDVIERTIVKIDGPTLTVTTPRQGGLVDLLGPWRRHREGIDIEITVPSGTALKIVTFTADVTVSGRCGGADIATASGTVDLDHVDGDLLLRYGSATSRSQRVSGSVTVRCGSGNATFGEIGGGLQSGCGSGRLDVASVRGAVRARSGSGAAHLAAVYGDVDVACGSGGLSIGLPTGISARLDVTTGSGRVNSELPIEQAPMSRTPTITVRARTGSGDVHVFRAA